MAWYEILLFSLIVGVPAVSVYLALRGEARDSLEEHYDEYK